MLKFSMSIKHAGVRHRPSITVGVRRYKMDRPITPSEGVDWIYLAQIGTSGGFL
jgi:hypothetical protein